MSSKHESSNSPPAAQSTVKELEARVTNLSIVLATCDPEEAGFYQECLTTNRSHRAVRQKVELGRDIYRWGNTTCLWE
jgi:hypothetical protein